MNQEKPLPDFKLWDGNNDQSSDLFCWILVANNTAALTKIEKCFADLSDLDDRLGFCDNTIIVRPSDIERVKQLILSKGYSVKQY